MVSESKRCTERILRDHPYILIGVLLAAITVAVFARTSSNGFLLFDDGDYVTNNGAVLSGLTWEGVKWAFQTTMNANRHPLTWISLMADYQVWGLNPTGFHLTNLLLHIANVLLLFAVLSRLTKSPWRSGFVAALFAVHPLHVESVAWVAERKDVLSAFFWMLTMLAYIRCVERPSLARRMLVIVLYALGLMAKPMLVTLPFVLLLLDYWPLRRFKGAGSAFGLLWEKLPLFGLSAISCYVTLVAQMQGHTVAALELLPFGARAANAVVSYVAYILKTVWPSHLAVVYPHPITTLPEWQVVGSTVLLIAVTFLVVRAARSRPYLAVGWLWYVVTLVPVIGLVQVGDQAMADRYTYIPLIGLFIMAAWGIGEWEKGRVGEREMGVAAVGVIAALMVVAWIQVGYWHDDFTLNRHGLAVTKGNYQLHLNLACALHQKKEYDEAEREYKEAIRIRPMLIQAHSNLALLYYTRGRYAEAWKEIHECERFGPVPNQALLEDLSRAMPEPVR